MMGIAKECKIVLARCSWKVSICTAAHHCQGGREVGVAVALQANGSGWEKQTVLGSKSGTVQN